ATLAFGKEDRDIVYARLTDEPFVVAVHGGLVKQISADPLQWQELSIFKFKPDQIHRLSVTTDKELSLERGENNQWHWLKGNGVIDGKNVQAVLTTLSSLHAVRWLGATRPQDGFDKPQLILTFTTSPDDKASHKVIIGARTDDGNWCAHVDGRDGTFVMSNSDLITLRLALMAQPSPSPSPTPSVRP